MKAIIVSSWEHSEIIIRFHECVSIIDVGVDFSHINSPYKIIAQDICKSLSTKKEDQVLKGPKNGIVSNISKSKNLIKYRLTLSR